MRKARGALFGVIVLLVVGGCSSLLDTDLETADELSADQAEWVAQVVAGAGTRGVNSGSAGQAAPASAPQAVAIYQPVDYRQACNVSGDIHVSGSISGSISDTGTGVVLLGLTETLTSCRHRTTSDGWFELNGAPYLSVSGTFSFLNGAPSTQQNMSIGGAFRWAFDTGQSGTCSIQLSVIFNSATGGGTVSGTVCGHGVSATV